MTAERLAGVLLYPLAPPPVPPTAGLPVRTRVFAWVVFWGAVLTVILWRAVLAGVEAALTVALGIIVLRTFGVLDWLL